MIGLPREESSGAVAYFRETLQTVVADHRLNLAHVRDSAFAVAFEPRGEQFAVQRGVVTACLRPNRPQGPVCLVRIDRPQIVANTVAHRIEALYLVREVLCARQRCQAAARAETPDPEEIVAFPRKTRGAPA